MRETMNTIHTPNLLKIATIATEILFQKGLLIPLLLYTNAPVFRCKVTGAWIFYSQSQQITQEFVDHPIVRNSNGFALSAPSI
jgi:hypothetical protein